MILIYVGLAIALTGLLSLCYALRTARRVERDYPSQGSTLMVEGCRLHYVRQGDGPVVALLHGSDGICQDYASVMAACETDRFDLIALDRPGHGYSEAPRRGGGNLDTQVRLLHGTMLALGITRPILVGHSWSGALALAYALQFPQETGGLVLISPWIYPTSDPPSFLLRAAWFFGTLPSYLLLNLTPLKRGLVQDSLQQAFAPSGVPPEYERMARALWQRWPYQMRVFLQENVDAWEQLRSLSTQYPSLNTPTILITGDQDTMLHAEHHAYRLAREMSGAELIVVPHAGHELLHTHPHVIREAIHRCHTSSDRAPQTRLPVIANTAPTERVRTLVFQYGWNVTAYQILNPDLKHWFTPDGRAAVGFAHEFGMRVAVGAPLCEVGRLDEVAEQFEQDAARQGEKVCWFGAAERFQAAVAGKRSYAALVVGAQPVWNPTHWTEIVQQNASLRSQINRAGNKGVVVSEWPRERAAQDANLQRCLEEWLMDHPFPTLHFLTEPVTLDRLTDRRVFVAEKDQVPVAFLIATPVPSRNGWLIEQITRSRSAPNGTSERLVDAAMRALAEGGYSYVTLGLVPLTRRGRHPVLLDRLWLRMTLTWIRAHGTRFYNFEGLDAFKAKFKPDSWEPIFALTNERHVSVRMLLAIAAAFSDGPLFVTLARAFGSAARQEFMWFRQRICRYFTHTV